MYSTFDSTRKVKIFYSMLKMQDVHGQGRQKLNFSFG